MYFRYVFTSSFKKKTKSVESTIPEEKPTKELLNLDNLVRIYHYTPNNNKFIVK